LKKGYAACVNAFGLLEEWAAAFDEAGPEEARATIPLPSTWSLNLPELLAEALLPVDGDALDDAEWRQHKVIEDKFAAFDEVPLAQKSSVSVVLRVLGQVWEGKLDGALKTQIVEGGVFSSKLGEYDMEKLPTVGPLERASERESVHVPSLVSFCFSCCSSVAHLPTNII